MKPTLWFLMSWILVPIGSAYAQVLDVMHVGWGTVWAQVSASSLVPVEEIYPDEGSWIFATGVQFESGNASDLQVAGPGFPEGMDVPLFEDNIQEYELELYFNSEQDLLSGAPFGTYTFTGSGSMIGSFTESIITEEFSLLTPKRIVNWDALQQIDPDQVVTIAWEPFLDQQDKPSFIDVEVFQESQFGSHTYWSTENLDEEGFGLPGDTTSVDIPAGTLTGNPLEPYEVWVFFGRIESLEEDTVFGTGMKGYVTTTETIFHMHVLVPGHINLPYKAWLEDETLGWIYGLTEDWGYSLSMGHIWVGNTPGWVYQTKLGWLYAVSGTVKEGCWLYSLQEGWIFTRADWNGWYIKPDESWHSMIDP